MRPHGGVCALPLFGCFGSIPRVELGDRLVSVNGVEIDGLEWPLVSKMLEVTEDDGVTNLGFFCDQVARCVHAPLPARGSDNACSMREIMTPFLLHAGEKAIFCHGNAGHKEDLAEKGRRLSDRRRRSRSSFCFE